MARNKLRSDIEYPLEILAVDSEMRQEVFEKLLMHIEAGFSINCFAELSDKKIFEFIKDFPLEFRLDRLEKAVRQAQTGWENIGRKQAEGTCLGNSRSWFYNMAQRYGWSDKVQVDANIKGNINVSVINYGDQSGS